MLHPFGGDLENRVPSRMAVTIIDRFEVVEVYEQNSERRTIDRGLLYASLQLGVEGMSIEEARHRVVVCEISNVLFRLIQFLCLSQPEQLLAQDRSVF